LELGAFLGFIPTYRLAVYAYREGLWRMSSVIQPQRFWFRCWAVRTADVWRLQLAESNYDMRDWRVEVYEDPAPTVMGTR
jgi:hypothetical protein